MDIGSKVAFNLFAESLQVYGQTGGSFSVMDPATGLIGTVPKDWLTEIAPAEVVAIAAPADMGAQMAAAEAAPVDTRIPQIQALLAEDIPAEGVVALIRDLLAVPVAADPSTSVGG